MNGPTMARNGGVAVARWCLEGALVDLLSGPNERARVGSLAAMPDLPGVILRRSGDTDLLEQAAGTFCVYEVEWEALLLAGRWPGSDSVQELLDRWVACIGSPMALDSAAEHPEWPAELAPPVVTNIGAESLYEVADAQLIRLGPGVDFP